MSGAGDILSLPTAGTPPDPPSTRWLDLPQLARMLGLDRRTVEPLLGQLGYEPILGNKRKRYLLPPEIVDEVRDLIRPNRDPDPDHRQSTKLPRRKKRARDRARQGQRPLTGEWWNSV